MTASTPDPIADRVLDRMTPLILGPPRWLRVALAVAAAAQLVIAVPWLIGADPLGLMAEADASHTTRDGAFGVAVGLAGAVTVWRHRYALAAAVLGGAIVWIQFGTGLIDEHADRVSMAVEANHLPALVVVVLIILAARPEITARRQPRFTDEDTADEITEPLRLVAPAADD